MPVKKINSKTKKKNSKGGAGVGKAVGPTMRTASPPPSTRIPQVGSNKSMPVDSVMGSLLKLSDTLAKKNK